MFAGEHRVVEEGEEVEFSGSFTRPEGLRNYQYSWEFSDGSEAVTGAPEEGATTVTATHDYENHRPQSFTVTLTVSADSDAGKVEGNAEIEVFVQESKGFVISGWSAEDNLKGAVRALGLRAGGRYGGYMGGDIRTCVACCWCSHLRLRAIQEAAEAEPGAARAIRIRRWRRLPYYGT